MKPEDLQRLEDKIRELVEVDYPFMPRNPDIITEPPIQLHHVLKAVLTPEARADDTDNCFMCGVCNLDVAVYTLCRDKWNLDKDFSQQDEKVHEFLSKLLCD